MLELCGKFNHSMHNSNINFPLHVGSNALLIHEVQHVSF